MTKIKAGEYLLDNGNMIEKGTITNHGRKSIVWRLLGAQVCTNDSYRPILKTAKTFKDIKLKAA